MRKLLLFLLVVLGVGRGPALAQPAPAPGSDEGRLSDAPDRPVAQPEAPSRAWPLLLGLVVGAGAGWWLGRRGRPADPGLARTPTNAPASPETQAAYAELKRLRAERNDYRKRAQALSQENHDLAERNRALEGQLSAPAETAAPVFSPLPILPDEPRPLAYDEPADDEVAPEAPAPAEPPGPRHLYAPTPETGFIEAHKLSAEPNAYLNLLLTLSPDRPGYAEYELNPQANQARLIGDGLQQLAQFFDFEQPATGRVAGLHTVRPGLLALEHDRWVVKARAQLEVT